MRYAHTNIIAGDWQKLSLFYQNVFGCIPVPPKRDLSGEWVDKLTNMKNVHIEGEHLKLPGYDGYAPTLEIFSYHAMDFDNQKAINTAGFAHIAFEVDDVRETLNKRTANGGSAVGEVVSKEYPGIVAGTFVYCKDIESNIIELQSWAK